MVVIVDGISIAASAEHLLNAELFTVVNAVLNVILCKEVQPENVSFPIVVTVLGMMILSSSMQDSKTSFANAVIPFGRITWVSN
jgi:hypothetical protein